MTPTNELREELREFIDEGIAFPGSEDDTRFTNAQIDRILIRANNIYAAAAEGWSLKANKLQRELGNLQGYSVGQEKYDFVRIKDALEFAMERAQYYEKKAGPGSLVLGVTPPDVL